MVRLVFGNPLIWDLGWVYAKSFCSSLQPAHGRGHIYPFNYILKYESNTINNHFILYIYAYSIQLISFSIAIAYV